MAAGPALDPRRLDQRLHGAVPRLRGRPAARASSARSGFAMQSLFIGLGAVIASALPWMLTNWFGVAARARRARIPTDRAAVVLRRRGGVPRARCCARSSRRRSTRPRTGGLPARRRRARGHCARARARSSHAIARDAATRCGSWRCVQVCTWLGLFCMWLYFPVAVARNVFGAPDETSPLYQQGVEWAGLCFGAYSAVCFAFSLRPAAPGRARSAASARTRSASLAGARGPALRRGHPRPVRCCCSRWSGVGHRLGEHPVHALRDPRRLAARRERPASTWASSTSSS